MTLLIPHASLAGDEEEKKHKTRADDSIDEELSTLEDADYPDLVAADEKSEIIDEFTLLMDDAMVETAARHRQEIGMSPSAITVITRQDIEASGANTIPDLLRMVPGVEVTLASPAAMGIAGRFYWTNQSYHYLVLVDGRDATHEALGQIPWIVQPISLEDVERIEIIRGPGSSLYGANAMAGVVTIVTRSVLERTSGWARLIGGEAGKTAVAARASTRIGGWGFSLGGEIERMGLFTDPRAMGVRLWKLRSVVEYRLSESRRLLVDGGLMGGEGPWPSMTGMLDVSEAIGTLRLAYRSEELRGHLYWSYSPITVTIKTPLEYADILLARPVPLDIDAHTLDGEVQWTLPDFWGPLLLITGVSGRASWILSDDLLDADTFSDPTSPRYHRPGLEHLEVRAGAFVHAEFSPIGWVTVTGGLRLDYNTLTGVFPSPRLAAVFRPAAGQFVRLGVARAFRKPCFQETHFHPMVEFPEEGPITGSSQQKFLEFMTRTVGNSKINNEELTSFEAGYLGQFLDGRLNVAMDLYCSLYRNKVEAVSNIVPDENGLPDLDVSSYRNENTGRDLDIFGGELSLRFDPSRRVRLLFSWTHQQVYNHDEGYFENRNPKNLLTLGGRFQADSGLLSSLYFFSRSDFVDDSVNNPAGILLPLVKQHMDSMVVVLGKLGFKWAPQPGIELEAGAKLFLPVSVSSPHFRVREKGGGVTSTGQIYGGFELTRMVTVYLQGLL